MAVDNILLLVKNKRKSKAQDLDWAKSKQFIQIVVHVEEAKMVRNLQAEMIRMQQAEIAKRAELKLI